MEKFFIKAAVVTVLVAAAFILIGRFVFIRTVNYEIAGLKIPSRYNMLTGTIKPITDYKGKCELPAMAANQTNNIGLSDEQVVIAKVRWALFQQWASGKPEYKDWESNPETFKKADEAFKKELGKNSPKIRVVE